MPGKEDLLDLCSRLRGEKLLVNSEIEHLQQLNTEIDEKLASLIQSAWISWQQQLTYSNLVRFSKDATPQKSCRHVKHLENTKFIESFRILGPHDAAVRDLIRVLLNNTQIIAEFLCTLDTLNETNGSLGASNADIFPILFSGLYGCCVFAADEKLVTETLLNLMRMQLAQNQNPRRVLRRGTCAFSRLYRLLSEGLFSAKLFLTCALHDSIMDVLSQDELFLDIDPSKAVIRFPPQERLKRFGEEGTPQYKENLSKYRKVIVNKLLTLSKRFINALKSSLHCFPPVLTLLVRRLHEMVRSTGKISDAETTLICTDLIFTYFICPAITKPEPLGIIDDTPISYIARFNLMQIGQILQSLAVCQLETLDPKLMDLYSQFESDCVSGIVQSILSASDSFSVDDIYPTTNQLAQRHFALFTSQELDKLISLLRRCRAINGDDKWVELKDILHRLPELLYTPQVEPSPTNTIEQNNGHRISGTSPSRKKTLKLPRPRVPHIHRSPSGERPSADVSPILDGRSTPTIADPPIETMVVHFVDEKEAPLGLIAEDKFIGTVSKGEKEASRQQEQNVAQVVGEKKTRFDLESVVTGNSDQLDESSDEQESVSSSLEGLGNLALTDNFSDVDGLPLSANVSGRGSPNISGRDTPLSAHTEQPGEAGDPEPEDTPSSPDGEAKKSRKLPELPDTARKKNRADIEEKFGKFEIPQPNPRERHRDETHSLVSDSWSTDVLASDSEFNLDLQNMPAVGAGGHHGGALPDLVPGQVPDIPRLDLIAEEIIATGAPPHIGGYNRSSAGHLEVVTGCDRSDTWSVDATASDSEAEVRNEDRMKEFDDCSVVTSVPGSLSCSSEQFSTPNIAGEVPTASAPPEIMFSAESKIFDSKQNLLRRQSSGSSFLSKSEHDLDDQAGSFGEKFEPPPNAAVADPFLPPNPPMYSATKEKKPVESGSMPNSKWSVKSFDSETSHDGDAETETSIERQSLGRLSFLIENSTPSTSMKADDFPVRIRNGTSTAASTSRFVSIDPNEGDRKSDLQSTGAIPKHNNRAILPSAYGGGGWSPMTRDKPSGNTSFDKDDKKQRNFFKNFKLSNLKNKVKRSQTDQSLISASFSNNNEPNLFLSGILPHSSSADLSSNALDASNETGEQILAKYRRQLAPSEAVAGGDVAEVAPLIDLSNFVPRLTDGPEQERSTTRPYFDASNVTNCQAFMDAKRKLRMVLSSVDIGTLPCGLDVVAGFGAQQKSPKESDLLQFLSILLAESLNTRQKFLSAQLQEVLRCLALFDSKSIRKLVRSLHEEHRHRSAYLTYLQQSRFTLLQTLSYINKLINKVQCEQSLSVEGLVEFCARLYLEQRWERQLRNFVIEFQKLELQDEKTEFVERFLATIYSTMLKDVMWRSASEDQLTHAQLSLERCVMSQIYVAALYPNGDADVLRDQVFHDTIRRLSLVVTPFHKDLQIPAVMEYHAECPWPLAQAEIAIINAFKTPRDKLGCVLRCCETIVHLLRVSRVSGAPAADDVIPVLVFVLIKANPPALLSTVQYINGFYGKRLHGEESYWWTQFCSGVEFIKIMADFSSV